jgi:hypothetical protein
MTQGQQANQLNVKGLWWQPAILRKDLFKTVAIVDTLP